MAAIQTVLVASDFSDSAAAALDWAIGVARTVGARVHLLHVYHRPAVMFSPYDVNPPESVVAEIPKAAEKRLDQELEKVKSAGLEGEAEVREGAAADVIAAAARDQGADLVVVGTRGLTGLEHVVLGSVAERTVRLSPCPVVTVKG